MPPDHRKHLQMALFADEGAQSLEESHPTGEERDQVIATHWKDVGLIQRAFARQLNDIQIPNVDTLARIFREAEKQQSTS